MAASQARSINLASPIDQLLGGQQLTVGQQRRRNCKPGGAFGKPSSWPIKEAQAGRETERMQMSETLAITAGTLAC